MHPKVFQMNLQTDEQSQVISRPALTSGDTSTCDNLKLIMLKFLYHNHSEIISFLCQLLTKCDIISTAIGITSSTYVHTNLCMTPVKSSFSVSRITFNNSVIKCFVLNLDTILI